MLALLLQRIGHAKKQAGVDEVIAGVLPEGKEAVIRSLKEKGKVAMVGDGINSLKSFLYMSLTVPAHHPFDLDRLCHGSDPLSERKREGRYGRRWDQRCSGAHESGYGHYISGAIGVASIGVGMWISEPEAYWPVLGSAGTYIAYLSGNVGGMRTTSQRQR